MRRGCSAARVGPTTDRSLPEGTASPLAADDATVAGLAARVARETTEELEHEIKGAAKRLELEQAAELRDRIRELRAQQIHKAWRRGPWIVGHAVILSAARDPEAL
jgi:excinuclease UvrABC nuclease subunit